MDASRASAWSTRTSTSAGTIAPGLSGPGLLPIEGRLDFLPGSLFEVELAGTGQGFDYEFVDVSIDSAADVIPDGELSVSFLAAFDALVTSGDVFVVLAAGDSLTGSFSNVASGGTVTTTEGHFFRVDYGVRSPFPLNQVVLSDFQPVPEPTSLVLMSVAALAAGVVAARGRFRASGDQAKPHRPD